jgi:hypothetical protein
MQKQQQQQQPELIFSPEEPIVKGKIYKFQSIGPPIVP